MRFCTLCRRAAPGGASICSYDGSGLAEDVAIEPGPGAQISGYRVIDVVAHGGTGTIYRAEDSSGNRVTLKLLDPALSGTPSVMHRIKRETKNAIKLASANVARVMDCGEHGGGFFIAREWVDGHPLSVALREEGQMEVARAAAIAYQICAGLALVHRVGLVHRDLKPNHVLLHEVDAGSWAIKLIDIGLAAKVEGIQASRDIYGSPLYLSPEQAEGKLVSFRSDLYSLGCLLFEMLAGAPPFSGDAPGLLEQHRTAEPPAIASLRGDVPAPLAQLTAKLLSKQASSRPFSAAMVQRELERVAPGCKDPLSPVVTGRARPAAAFPAAPSPAPAGGGDDFGMAQTLFGGTSADVDALAAAAVASQGPAPEMFPGQPQGPASGSPSPEAQLAGAATAFAPSPAPGSPDFSAPTAYAGDVSAPLGTDPTLPSPAVPLPAPGAFGQAPAVQPAGGPEGTGPQPYAGPQPAAPQPAPPQAPVAAFPATGPGVGTHKKTMLGFPVVTPEQRRAAQAGGAPGQVDELGATIGVGAQPGPGTPAQVAGSQAVQPAGGQVAPGAVPQPGMAQPGAAMPPGAQMQPGPYGAPGGGPYTDDIVSPPRSSALKWVLIALGIFLGLVVLSAIIGVVSCVVCAEPAGPAESVEERPVVELLDGTIADEDTALATGEARTG